MFKKISFFALLIALFSACGGETAQQTTKQEDGDTATSMTVEHQKFGEAITADGAIGMDGLLTKLETSDSVATKFTGTVESVCQKKGCWMNIVADNPEQGEVFVKFKDYGFFMPLDIAGRKVVMDGYAFKETTSIDELRHYAEDEGKSAEEIAAITEPVEEYKFIASGVLLLEE
ncbi:MAG: DUF4920 domain-containing protein [Bacteroidota bacterium]